MPLETLYHSEPMIRTSSTSSGNEESSTKDKPSERKTKKYVKKKGETRKRNSKDFSEVKNAVELTDEILKKLDNMVIKNEIENSTEFQGTSNHEFLKLEEKSENEKNLDDIKNEKKVDKSYKICSIDESELKLQDKIHGELKEKIEDSETMKKDSMTEFADNKSQDKDTSKYIIGDRKTMQILKGVTKFSKKFMKAMKKLEDDHLDKDSSSTSESSESSSTDSSSSSSCSCSSCCETESSTCTCSDCCSEKSSTCSCSDSNFESSGTSSSSFSSLTSSESSSSSTTCTSNSEITSP